MYTDHTFTKVILSGDLQGVQQHLLTNPDLEELDEYGFTPLIEATIANQLNIVALLLEKGAQVNNQDATGRTALHWAVENHNLSICDLLLDYQANPNAYTYAGQPVLVFPYLREQKALKDLLYRNKAQVSFTQDFIQAKLLGHRYELTGQADIIDPEGQFIAIDYEGFFLEFVIEVITNSLERYCNHFMARPYRKSFKELKTIINLFKRASDLLKYQKYTIDIQKVADQINTLLDTELLFLPIAYEGHAISFVQYKDMLIRCDRGENSKKEGSIVVYRMKYGQRWTKDFVKKILYEKQTESFMTEGISSFLGLQSIRSIPIQAQRIGNCSWANIEASILVLLHILEWNKRPLNHVSVMIEENIEANELYHHWLLWDKTRALEECFKSFNYASPARKASIAMLLGAVLFQSCYYQNDKDIKVARQLIPILMVPEYQYILKSYLKVYWHDSKTPEGHNLMQLLNSIGVMPPLLT